MSDETNCLSDWRPEGFLNRAATLHGMTIDEYRRRIHEVAAESNVPGPHLTLEEACDLAALSGAQAAHLSDCAFCKRLTQTIHPSERAISDLLSAVTPFPGVTKRPERPERGASGLLWRPMRPVAAAVAALVVGYTFAAYAPGTPWPARLSVTTSEGASLYAKMFEKASRYYASGQTAMARPLVLIGLHETAVNDAEAGRLEEVLTTSRAATGADQQSALHKVQVLEAALARPAAERSGEVYLALAGAQFRAGDEVAAYDAVLKYLQTTQPRSDAVTSFENDFVTRLPQSPAAANSETTDATARQ